LAFAFANVNNNFKTSMAPMRMLNLRFLSKIGFWASVSGMAFVFAACSKGSGITPSQVSKAFVEDLVLPSYTVLAQESEALQDALQTLADNPTEAHLAAARQQWIETRPLWEKTESWAFGPAATEGLDGDLDDWPVSTLELDQALATDPFTADTFAKLGTTSIGFHGIEFILYGDGDTLPRAADLTPQEYTYLGLAGEAFQETAQQLLNSWMGDSGFGAQLMEDPDATVLEMVEGIIGTLEEVHLEKLAAVLEDGPEGLESRFSGNTNVDIVANVSGAQRVYEDTGLKQLLAAKDGDLAQQLSEALSMGVMTAEALPSRLSKRLDDPEVTTSMVATIAATESAFHLMSRALGVLDSF